MPFGSLLVGPDGSVLAEAIERSSLGRVVFALSTEQLTDFKRSDGFRPVPQDGPALFAEARVPLDGYYRP